MGRVLENFFKIKSGPSLRDKLLFRVSHPFLPTIIFFSSALLLVYFAQATGPRPWYALLGLLSLGVLLWTLIEYLLHRFLFHWTTVREPWRTLFSGLHIAHHRNPEEKSLIIAPPLVSLFSSLLFYVLLLLFTWSAASAALILAGIQMGYVYYEWVHYGVHEFQPHTPLSRYQKRYHLTHHFKKPKEGFGVTVPFWDWLFGTAL